MAAGGVENRSESAELRNGCSPSWVVQGKDTGVHNEFNRARDYERLRVGYGERLIERSIGYGKGSKWSIMCWAKNNKTLFSSFRTAFDVPDKLSACFWNAYNGSVCLFIPHRARRYIGHWYSRRRQNS